MFSWCWHRHVYIEMFKCCLYSVTNEVMSFDYGTSIKLNLPWLQSLGKCGSASYIGIKRMGELDARPFYNAVNRKYSEKEASDKAAELCLMWVDHLRDHSWHPFKTVMGEDGKTVVCIQYSSTSIKFLSFLSF